jgi:tripartite-type tricarboxylate transporter receptor subunit TctC
MGAALTRALADADVKARIEEQGCDVVASDPAECGRFFQAEVEKWGRVIREQGITAN